MASLSIMSNDNLSIIFRTIYLFVDQFLIERITKKDLSRQEEILSRIDCQGTGCLQYSI